VPVSASRALAHLDSEDSEDRPALREKYSWAGSLNAYGGYAGLTNLDGGDGSSAGMGMEKWKMLSGEESSRFDVKTGEMPAASRFSDMDPGQFKPPATARGAGATLSQIPAPAGQ